MPSVRVPFDYRHRAIVGKRTVLYGHVRAVVEVQRALIEESARAPRETSVACQNISQWAYLKEQAETMATITPSMAITPLLVSKTTSLISTTLAFLKRRAWYCCSSGAALSGVCWEPSASWKVTETPVGAPHMTTFCVMLIRLVTT